MCCIRVLHYIRLERLAKDKHASLVGLGISYEEKVLLNMHLVHQ